MRITNRWLGIIFLGVTLSFRRSSLPAALNTPRFASTIRTTATITSWNDNEVDLLSPVDWRDPSPLPRIPHIAA